MFIYNLVILLYGFVIRMASLKKNKAKQWVNGRRNWRENYKSKISELGDNKIVWIHCASYGEFEQGRPLIDAIKQKYPKYKVLLTFFSPSGFEAFKNWNGADAIFYLPLDTPQNAKDFLNIVKPNTVIFIKYEFWLNFLNELQKRNTPTYLVSAVFKPHHPFFKWYGSIFRQSLKTFNQLFIQDEKSADLLRKIKVNNFEVSGDTRFDRVMEIKKNHQSIPFIEEFCAENKIIVAGSTWLKDEEILLTAFQEIKDQKIKLIIAPHEVNENSINTLESLLKKMSFTYCKYSAGKPDLNSNVLIIDTIGLLSKIYYYANVTYIGGGFNEGIHNCLEPSVYLKPVIFYGNDFDKYNEAVDLVKIGAAKNINSKNELSTALHYYLNQFDKPKTEADISEYFKKNLGTTDKIIRLLELS